MKHTMKMLGFLYFDGPVYTIFNLKEVEQGHLIWLHPRR